MWLLCCKSIYASKAVWGFEDERGTCSQKPGREGRVFLVSVPAIVMSL